MARPPAPRAGVPASLDRMTNHLISRGILRGGSHERDDWNLEPDFATTERILRDNGTLFGSMRTPAAG